MKKIHWVALSLVWIVSGCAVAAEDLWPREGMSASIYGEQQLLEAESYLPDLSKATNDLELVNDGQCTEWRSDQAWEVVTFRQEGLLSGHCRLYRDPEGLHGALTVREQALVYSDPQQASAALIAAAQEFVRFPTLLQEGGLRTPPQPFQAIKTSHGDEAWTAGWRDVYGVQGYACLARYDNLLILLTASQSDLSGRSVANWHRALEQRITGMRKAG